MCLSLLIHIVVLYICRGGFIALSVLPKAQVGDVNSLSTMNAFNDPANIFYTTCYNSGPTCQACVGCGDKFGLGGDGADFQTIKCNNNFNIPTWLPDGEYVMKFMVFGGGDSNGVRNEAHGDYYNCHNFKVQGGSSLTSKPTNNGHIQFKMNDNAIDNMNSKLGLSISQNQCMFSGGANAPNVCKFIAGVDAPACKSTATSLSTCGGSAVADSRQACLGSNTEAQTKGGDVYNYLLGKPTYHPQYTEVFSLLSHTRSNPVTYPVNGGNGDTSLQPLPTCNMPKDGNCIQNWEWYVTQYYKHILH
jgi:hypothetical protein